MKNRKVKKLLAAALALSMTLGSFNGFTAFAQETRQETQKQTKEAADTDNYKNNQGKLKENPLIQLPLGAVRAEGWLENQLLLMKNGITGNMKYFHDYNNKGSAWLGYTGPGANTWENGPYFVRGLTAIAYALNDEELTNETLDWLEWSISSQQPNGYFGPANENSWWSRMPMLCAIRDFYEAVEQKPLMERSEREVVLQEKVLKFLENYFAYQASELPGRPLSNWADARGGDNLEIVYWLYNQLYDEGNPQGTDWLLNLGDLIYRQTNNWEDIYNNSTVRTHVVNTSQGMKTPALYSQYKDDEKYVTALSNGLDNMAIDHGRVDGLPNSDEAARENRSTRGSETCGTVEGILSTGITMKIQGEAWMGDRLETLAYNALPAAYPSDYSGHAYYILQNQVMNTVGNHEFDCDHGDSSAFGAPCGFDCCFANNHMGWAKFVQNMWMAKENGGLTLVAYGPSRVTAKVADGKTAKFEEKTDYPFKDTVNLEYFGDTAAFDLDLRIPEWAKSAEVMVNGTAQTGVNTGSFYTVNRTWKAGDKVTVKFTSEVKLTTWYNNSTAVQKGALVYGLKIEEDWRTYAENDARELKVEHKEDLPLREVYPASDWNFGLVTDANASFEVVESPEVALQPFESDSAPVQIIAKGVYLPEWTLDGNIAGPQPFGPLDYSADQIQDITLVPYGCQRLRISHFPTMNNEQDTESVVRTKGDPVTRNGVTYQEFDNIVVPKAQNYTLKVQATGTGTMIINSKYRQEVNGSFELTGLKGLLSGGFAFDAGHYNNIRFTGDIQIQEVRVEVVNREISDITIVNAIRNGSTGKLLTNMDPQETPFRVLYGTEPGVYTQTLRGINSGTATLQGLDPDKTYYAKVIASIGGAEKESREVALEVSADQGGWKPNPNVPTATYEGFSTLNYMTGPDGLWRTWGGAAVQAQAHPNTTRASEIKFGTTAEQKAVLVAQGAQNWVDYVVEADLTLDQLEGNNAGIMFRATDIGEGADAYHGYYAGVGIANGKPGIMIGYADGGWHDIEIIPKADVVANQKYTLKVVVYSDMYAVYLNDELVKLAQDDKFSKGTVGLRSYKVPFTGHDVRVRSVTEEDLMVFNPFLPEESQGLNPHNNHRITEYAGFAATAEETKNAFHFYDPQNKIQVTDDGAGKVQMNLGKGERVKAVLNTEGSENWVDYVAEAKLKVDVMDTNNCGIMFRSTGLGDDPDAYNGYFAGLGVAPKNSGTLLMLGYANGEWHDMKVVPWEVHPGQEYTLKVVAYDDQFAIYVDGELACRFTDDKFAKGTVGLRSYNEAFSASGFTVRNITKEDLAVFEEEPEDPDVPDEPVVIPNFKDDFTTDANWTKVGNGDLFALENNQLILGKSNDVKAAAGDEAWSDMVYTANVTLRDGDGNAGLLVRTSKEGRGADNYFGYYFGVNGKGYEVGKSSNAWKQLETGDLTLDPSVSHELKVAAYKDKLMFCVDGKPVTVIQDPDHAKGKIGIRGYNRSFATANVEVRELTESDKEEIQLQEERKKQMEITGYSAFDSIQVKYPRISNATSYRLLFGTESGKYTNEFTDIYLNGYKGSGIFTHDKVAFSTLQAGTYYIKMIAMNGNTEVAYSNEIAVTTGLREAVDSDLVKLDAVMGQANDLDTKEFTPISLNRLNRAKTYAGAVKGDGGANQIQLATAADLLSVAINTPDSFEFTVEKNNADKSGLQECYDTYKGYKQSSYTETSWKPFAEALKKASEVLAAADPTQTEVDAAETELAKTANALVRVGMTDEELAEAIAKAEQAKKAAEEAKALADAAKTEADKLAKEAEEAKKAALEAQKKAEELADASEAERLAAVKAAEEAAAKAKDAEKKAEEAEAAVSAAEEAMRKTEEAALLAQKEVQAVKAELAAAKEKLDQMKAEAAKAKEAAERARKDAEESARKAEAALKALNDLKAAQKEAEIKSRTYKVGSLRYRVLDVNKKTAMVVGSVSKNAKSVNVPSKVTIAGISCQVTEIGAKAFQNYKQLKKVTLGTNIVKIGSRAFYNDKKLTLLTIKSSKLAKVNKYCLKGIAWNAVIDAPNKKVNSYRKVLKNGNAGQQKTVRIK